MTMSTIYTIGHSTHTVEHFVELLQRHDISAIADVRSVPYSEYTPQFNRDFLTDYLGRYSIEYLFMGDDLGARVNDSSCYDSSGKVSYSSISRRSGFIKATNRLIAGSSKHRISLMCSEHEPLDCHRTLLVSQALIDCDSSIFHILGDGELESHSSTLERLLKTTDRVHDDLFLSREELLLRAIRRQESRIAYSDVSHKRDTA